MGFVFALFKFMGSQIVKDQNAKHENVIEEIKGLKGADSKIMDKIVEAQKENAAARKDIHRRVDQLTQTSTATQIELIKEMGRLREVVCTREDLEGLRKEIMKKRDAP